MITQATLKRLEKIKPVLQKYGVDVAYLFGSRADGTAYADSDYDFAVLFKSYLGKNGVIPMEFMLKIQLIFRTPANSQK